MGIKVGISSCLLGQEVRYDGTSKQLRIATESLSRYFDFVPECPEVGIGMSIPRKPIRLVGDPNNPHVVAVHDPSLDYTEALYDYGQKKAQQHKDWCGYIFMKNSPSCGVFRVKVYQDNGYPSAMPGRGMYAQAITDSHPLLPVEESGRLSDPTLRENFVTRVFAYSNWRQLVAEGITPQKLIEFHARYKYCLMAHSPTDYAELGRFLSAIDRQQIDFIAEQYFEKLMTALAKLASRKTHTNVLMHLQGYLKKYLSSQEKQELVKLIEQYRTAQLPLIVPLTLLKHHFNNHPNNYITQQAYLQPYPDDLSLRNHI